MLRMVRNPSNVRGLIQSLALISVLAANAGFFAFGTMFLAIFFFYCHRAARSGCMDYEPGRGTCQKSQLQQADTHPSICSRSVKLLMAFICQGYASDVIEGALAWFVSLTRPQRAGLMSTATDERH